MFSRRRLRLLAAHVLLGWVFALATGIVHACLVGPSLRDAPAAGAHAAHEHHAASSMHAPDEASPAAPPDAMAACEKFCDESLTVAQAPKPQVDPATGGWIVLPAPLSPLVAPPGEPPRLPAPDPERWRFASPLSIVFLRLAL